MANFASEPRVALFSVDYPNRRRLKVLGRATVITDHDDAPLVAQLMPQGYEAIPERAFLIDVMGFDWNCPQHITQRFTEAEIADAIAPLTTELASLRSEVARLRSENTRLPAHDRPHDPWAPSRRPCRSRSAGCGTLLHRGALRFEAVGEIADYPALFVSDSGVLITLWQVADPQTATPFDRRAKVGLHDLALKVAD